jgi:hypothetical protein
VVAEDGMPKTEQYSLFSRRFAKNKQVSAAFGNTVPEVRLTHTSASRWFWRFAPDAISAS